MALHSAADHARHFHRGRRAVFVLPAIPGVDSNADDIDAWLAALCSSGALAEATKIVSSGRQMGDQMLRRVANALLSSAPGFGTSSSSTCPSRGPRASRLQHLDLSSNGLTDSGAIALAESLTSLREQVGGRLLQSLRLSANQIGPGGAEALAISFFPACSSSINRGGREYELVLSENPLGDSGVASVAAAIRIRQCLSVLQICDVGCGGNGCQAVVECLPWLRGLDLSYNAIPVGELNALASSLPEPLQTLGLAHMASAQGGRLIRSSTAPALRQALLRPDAPSLVSLNLTGNDLQDSGLQPVVEAFQSGGRRTLRHLELASNRLSDGNLLAQLLAGPGGSCLQGLGLEANELGDLAMAALSAGLAMSPLLRRLGLARNRFGDAGAVALARAVATRGGTETNWRGSGSGKAALLRWLHSVGDREEAEAHQLEVQCAGLQVDLSFNFVTDEAAKVFADVASQASCIRRINLYDTSVGPEGRCSLEASIRDRHARVQESALQVLAMLRDGGDACSHEAVFVLPWPFLVEGLGLEGHAVEFGLRVTGWLEQLPQDMLQEDLPREQDDLPPRQEAQPAAKQLERPDSGDLLSVTDQPAPSTEEHRPEQVQHEPQLQQLEEQHRQHFEEFAEQQHLPNLQQLTQQQSQVEHIMQQQQASRLEQQQHVTKQLRLQQFVQSQQKPQSTGAPESTGAASVLHNHTTTAAAPHNHKTTAAVPQFQQVAHVQQTSPLQQLTQQPLLPQQQQQARDQPQVEQLTKQTTEQQQASEVQLRSEQAKKPHKSLSRAEAVLERARLALHKPTSTEAAAKGALQTAEFTPATDSAVGSSRSISLVEQAFRQDSGFQGKRALDANPGPEAPKELQAGSTKRVAPRATSTAQAALQRARAVLQKSQGDFVQAPPSLSQLAPEQATMMESPVKILEDEFLKTSIPQAAPEGPVLDASEVEDFEPTLATNFDRTEPPEESMLATTHFENVADHIQEHRVLQEVGCLQSALRKVEESISVERNRIHRPARAPDSLAANSFPTSSDVLPEPDEEAPAMPERTVRLEREVAELREDVRRIEHTVSSLQAEPEQEDKAAERATRCFDKAGWSHDVGQASLGNDPPVYLAEKEAAADASEPEPHVDIPHLDISIVDISNSSKASSSAFPKEPTRSPSASPREVPTRSPSASPREVPTRSPSPSSKETSKESPTGSPKEKASPKKSAKGTAPKPPPPSQHKASSSATSPVKTGDAQSLVLPVPPPKAPGKGGKSAGKGGKGGPPPKGPPAKGSGPKAPAPKGVMPKQPAEAKAQSKAPFGKKVYWKQLDLTDSEGTIFSEEGRARGPGSPTGIDFSALTRMFEAESDKGRQLERRSSGVLNKAQQKSVGTKLLSDHRARNIAIVLKRLPISPKELSNALRKLEWEATGISTDDLDQILEVIPTQEEAKLLKEHSSGDAREKLRDVEQMVLPLAQLSRATARVRLLNIAREARSQFKASTRTLASIRNACSAIQRSEMLREVMLLALELGNYINHGDGKKGAKAITVGSLMALRDFKAGGMSSLHFLCASLLRADPQRNAAEVLQRELRPAERIAKLQVQVLQGTLRTFGRDLDIVNAECQNFIAEYEGTEAKDELSACPKAADDEQDLELEEAEAAAEAAAATDSAVDGDPLNLEREDADATRWVEDVMKVRGSARKRLRCMRRVVEKLANLLKADMEGTAEQALATLRFCGIPLPKAAKAKEVPVDFETLLSNLAEFTKVFKVHWDEVKKDLPKYQQLFGGSPPRSSTS